MPSEKEVLSISCIVQTATSLNDSSLLERFSAAATVSPPSSKLSSVSSGCDFSLKFLKWKRISTEIGMKSQNIERKRNMTSVENYSRLSANSISYTNRNRYPMSKMTRMIIKVRISLSNTAFWSILFTYWSLLCLSCLKRKTTLTSKSTPITR